MAAAVLDEDGGNGGCSNVSSDRRLRVPLPLDQNITDRFDGTVRRSQQ